MQYGTSYKRWKLCSYVEFCETWHKLVQSVECRKLSFIAIYQLKGHSYIPIFKVKEEEVRKRNFWHKRFCNICQTKYTARWELVITNLLFISFWKKGKQGELSTAPTPRMEGEILKPNLFLPNSYCFSNEKQYFRAEPYIVEWTQPRLSVYFWFPIS